MASIGVFKGQKIKLLCCPQINMLLGENRFSMCRYSDLKEDIVKIKVKDFDGSVIISEGGARYPMVPESPFEHYWVLII